MNTFVMSDIYDTHAKKKKYTQNTFKLYARKNIRDKIQVNKRIKMQFCS